VVVELCGESHIDNSKVVVELWVGVTH
jgi:hypothetical protein